MIRFNDVGKTLLTVRELTDFIIIGDTILDILLKRKGTESDVDIFPLSISAFADDDLIREFAYKQGWDYGRTPIDTPRLMVDIDDQQLQIDLYDNIQDFYIPTQLIQHSTEIRLGEYDFKSVPIEGYIVLKANAYRDEDEDELKGIFYLIGENKLSIDKNKIFLLSQYFEENSKSILERLKGIGIISSVSPS